MIHNVIDGHQRRDGIISRRYNAVVDDVPRLRIFIISPLSSRVPTLRRRHVARNAMLARARVAVRRRRH